MSALLALASALAYGASDFLAGLMSRRASVFVVMLVGQSTAAAVTWLALPLAGGAVNGRALAWGLAAGGGAFAGTLFLYRGLAIGRMSVVAPLSAVLTAAGAAVVGVVLGDRLTAIDVVGIVTACAAIALVTASDSDRAAPMRRSRRAIAYALAAGVGFALLFVALNRAGSGSGLWPVAIAQSAGEALIFVTVIALGVSGHLRLGEVKRIWAGAVPAGALGAAATILFLAATRLGLLSVSTVLASLYPAATVALAIVVLRERLRPLQGAGLVLAAASVALLASRG